MTIVNSSLRRCGISGRLTPALFAVAMTAFAVQVTAEPLPEEKAVPTAQDRSKGASEAQPAATAPPAGWKCCTKGVGYNQTFQWRPSCTSPWKSDGHRDPDTKCPP